MLLKSRLVGGWSVSASCWVDSGWVLENGSGNDWGVTASVDQLPFYDHVDVIKVQVDVVRLVAVGSGRSSVRQVDVQMGLDTNRKTVVLMFMACLFLEMEDAI